MVGECVMKLTEGCLYRIEGLSDMVHCTFTSGLQSVKRQLNMVGVVSHG